MENKPAKALSYLALGDSYTSGESAQKEACLPVQLVKQLAVLGYRFKQPTIIAKTGWTTGELYTEIQKENIQDTYHPPRAYPSSHAKVPAPVWYSLRG